MNIHVHCNTCTLQYMGMPSKLTDTDLCSAPDSTAPASVGQASDNWTLFQELLRYYIIIGYYINPPTDMYCFITCFHFPETNIC